MFSLCLIYGSTRISPNTLMCTVTCEASLSLVPPRVKLFRLLWTAIFLSPFPDSLTHLFVDLLIFQWLTDSSRHSNVLVLLTANSKCSYLNWFSVNITTWNLFQRMPRPSGLPYFKIKLQRCCRRFHCEKNHFIFSLPFQSFHYIEQKCH